MKSNFNHLYSIMELICLSEKQYHIMVLFIKVLKMFKCS